MPDAPDSLRAPVRSADRTLTVLEHLAASQTRQSLAALSAQLGIPKSSLHSLLRTLVTRDWVSTDETGTRFGLGYRALLVGSSYLATDDVISLGQDLLDDLNSRLGETVHFGRLEGDQIVYLAKRDAMHQLRIVSRVGSRFPAYATAMGKALLAELPTAEVEQLLPEVFPALTERTLATRVDLLDQLRTIRIDGAAEDREESTPGVHCFAVAIRREQPARLAFSCSVPTHRLDATLAERVHAELFRTREIFEARYSIAV